MKRTKHKSFDDMKEQLKADISTLIESYAEAMQKTAYEEAEKKLREEEPPLDLSQVIDVESMAPSQPEQEEDQFNTWIKEDRFSTWEMGGGGESYEDYLERLFGHR